MNVKSLRRVIRQQHALVVVEFDHHHGALDAVVESALLAEAAGPAEMRFGDVALVEDADCRVVLESIADNFKKRSFVINVVNQDGTIYTLGWAIGGSTKNAYTSGKLKVKMLRGENGEALIDDDGAIIPFVDIKIVYVKDAAGGVDD